MSQRVMNQTTYVPKGDESNKTLNVTLGLVMQFRSSRITLLIAILDINTGLLRIYIIHIIASNIPQLKITAVSQ